MSLEDMAGDDEYADDPPAITLGDLRDGESVTIRPSGGVETFTSQYADDDEENDALRWPAYMVRSDYVFTPGDAAGAAPEPVEADDEIVLISWSNTLAQAILAEADEPDASDLVGTNVEIQKFGSGYEVSYRLRTGDDAATDAE
jgi:hypothetical protein